MLKATAVQKVYKQAQSSLEVLRGVDFSINEGEFVSIVGPSGAGKSTLLHILGGLDNPTKGLVEFDGQNIYKLNDVKRAAFRNQQVGFVFQFYHLLPEFSALENVLIPSYVKDMRVGRNASKDGEQLLRKVGLASRMTHKPYQLSGGEQQRVAIARALINQPKIILCDEPTGNLDSKNGQEVMDFLIQLNKENRQTLLIITHDERIAEKSDRVVNIVDGEIVN